MSEVRHGETTHGAVDNDSINTEPWLERWWALLVIGYAFLVAMFCLLMTNQTYGH